MTNKKTINLVAATTSLLLSLDKSDVKVIGDEPLTDDIKPFFQEHTGTYNLGFVDTPNSYKREKNNRKKVKRKKAKNGR